MRVLGAVVGILGGLLGLSIAFLNSITETMFLATEAGGLGYLLIQLGLAGLCLLAVVGSAVAVWHQRVGRSLLATATVGVVILGGVDLAPYLTPEFRPYFSSIVFPVVAAPLLIAATVLAVLAARRNA